MKPEIGCREVSGWWATAIAGETDYDMPGVFDRYTKLATTGL